MVSSLLLAAGRGARFGAAENKVFAPLAGIPVFRRALLALAASPRIDRIHVVCAPGEHDRIKEHCRDCSKVAGLVTGGEERGDSVWNGLQALTDPAGIVAVHDSARPFPSPLLIDRLVEDACRYGAAAPALPVSDTLKRSTDGTSTVETVDRKGLWCVQTPQVFRLELLLEAMSAARDAGYRGTDDASYVERIGHPVHLTEGEPGNIKITTPADLAAGEAMLRQAPREVRTGFGYDAHVLKPGRELWLGGVLLVHPAGLGLDGHSDADVLLHAIADAILGAAALGDIGLHFPNTDARYLGCPSLDLLREAACLVAAEGWEVLHVDATLIAERPRIRPHVEEMQRKVAAAVAGAGLPPPAVSIKATTNEGLGALGREQGMAAHAVATVRRIRP